MKKVEKEPETPLPLGQFVKMTAPVFIFGVILPIVDIFTDLRMIIRLYVGLPGCKNSSSICEQVLVYDDEQNITAYEPSNCYKNPCYVTEDFDKYCQDNPGECSTEQHPIFASMLLGKLNMMLLGEIDENCSSRTSTWNLFMPFL